MDWFRMYAEFATDPKVQMMSETMQRRLVMLFCLQCGNVTETLHETERDDAIAFALRISREECDATRQLFASKGFIHADWTICNWGKRQYVSDSSTSRVRKHRDAAKQAAETTDANRETLQKRSGNALDTDTDTEKTTSKALRDSANHAKRESRCDAFEKFWEAFADKRDRKKAQEAWNRINPSADLAEKIAAAAAGYAAYRAAVLLPTGQTPKMAQGWLSGERWFDELPNTAYQPEQIALIDAYNANIGDLLPSVDPEDWTPLRASKIDAALSRWTPEKWGEFFAWVRDNCMFRFSASFDWLISPDGFTAVKAGTYLREVAA